MREHIERCVRKALDGNVEAALADIDKVIAAGAGDESAYAHFVRGNILVQMGRHQEGLAALRTAAQLDHNQPSILFNLGMEELTVGNKRRGREHLERAVQLGHAKAAHALETVRAGEAIAVHHGDEGEANVVLAHVERGITSVGQERFADALVDYNRAIELASEVGHLYTLRGVVFEKLEQFDKALADHNRALELDPDNAVARYNRGVVHGRLGHEQEALADYTRAIALDPHDADAFYNRGILHSRLARFAEAATDFSEAVRLRPGYALAYNNRGNALAQLGRQDEALRDYTHAVSLEPEESLFHLNKGACHYNRGENDECVVHLLKAVRLGDDRAVDMLRQITGRDWTRDEILRHLK